MSATVLVPVADAVVYELENPTPNLAAGFVTWSQTFTAERTYNSEQKLEDANALKVFVVPGRSPFDQSSRAGLQSERDIAVFVRKKLDANYSQADVDDLVALLEQLNWYFAHLPQATLTNCDARAHYLSSEISPFFPNRLRTQREYLGVLVVTFRVYEDE